jgi:hypothetical protein
MCSCDKNIITCYNVDAHIWNEWHYELIMFLKHGNGKFARAHALSQWFYDKQIDALNLHWNLHIIKSMHCARFLNFELYLLSNINIY